MPVNSIDKTTNVENNTDYIILYVFKYDLQDTKKG